MGGSVTKVLPGLYAGRVDNAKNEEDVMANGISHILLVQHEKCGIEQFTNCDYLEVVIAEQDDSGLFRRLSDTNDFIHQARIASGNVLVCSDSGASASVAVVAAYLMSIYSLDWQSAVGAVQGLKHGVRPIATLTDQLTRFDSHSSLAKSFSDQQEEQKQQQLLHTDPGGGPPASPSPLTACSERERLEVKFGLWPRLDEDLRLLQSALDSRNQLTDSDQMPLPMEPSSSSFSASPPSLAHLSLNDRVGRGEENRFERPNDISEFGMRENVQRWTPPNVPPPTPAWAGSMDGKSFANLACPADLERTTRAARIDSTICADDMTGVPHELSEADLFPLDVPLIDPMEQLFDRQSLNDMSHPNTLGVFENDFSAGSDEDDGDADVPGSIPVPSGCFSSSVGFSRSYRRPMAQSYQTHSSTGGNRRSFEGTQAVAQSMAPSRMFRRN